MKKILKYIGILLALYFTVLTCNTLISKKLDETNRENLKPFYEEQRAIRNVETVTKMLLDKLPLKNNDGNTLYKVEYIRDQRIMKYYYQSNEDIKTLNQLEINIYQNGWKENLIQTMKANPNNKSFVTAKVTFICELIDLNGKEILMFEISPTEYR